MRQVLQAVPLEAGEEFFDVGVCLGNRPEVKRGQNHNNHNDAQKLNQAQAPCPPARGNERIRDFVGFPVHVPVNKTPMVSEGDGGEHNAGRAWNQAFRAVNLFAAEERRPAATDGTEQAGPAPNIQNRTEEY
jgi:hypothetical protein